MFCCEGSGCQRVVVSGYQICILTTFLSPPFHKNTQTKQRKPREPAAEGGGGEGGDKPKKKRKPRVRNKPTEKLDEVCNNYLEGRCRYGEQCRRQHVGDVPQKVEKVSS